MLLNTFKRVWSAFDKATTDNSKLAPAVIFAFIVFIITSITYSVVSDAREDYRANHAPPAEDLQLAHWLCPPTSNGAVACDEAEMDIALHHLDKIRPSAPEYAEASQLRSLIQTIRVKVVAARQKEEQANAALLVKQQAERDWLMHQSIVGSRKRMLRNSSGQAHDPFTCGTATDNSPTISFDYGHYCSADDGRWRLYGNLRCCCQMHA